MIAKYMHGLQKLMFFSTRSVALPTNGFHDRKLNNKVLILGQKNNTLSA